jgi:transcriptional regulator with XRE-family HTH domain
MTHGAPLSFEDARPKTSPIRADVALADQFFTVNALETASLWKQTCGAVVISMLVGTGGIASGATVSWIPHESPSYRVRCTSLTSQSPVALLDTRERMAGLRRYLSLNISDLARVLRVERPTVYAWLKGSSAPHPGNLKRLEKIYRLAREWRARSSTPMGVYVRESIENGCSVLDHLAEENPDEQAIGRAFSAIRARLDQEQTTRSARRRSVDESAQLHGFPSVPEAVQKKNFDEATRL